MSSRKITSASRCPHLKIFAHYSSTRRLPVAYWPRSCHNQPSRAVEALRQRGISARIIAEVLPKQPALIEII